MIPVRKKKEEDHYVTRVEFTDAMILHSRAVAAAKADGLEEPPITPYIATCFYKIANGLARKPNFFAYTYRDEMVADAIENCVKVAGLFKPEAVTRSGKPNAFGYFTQICWYAFLRRMSIERKQQDIKEAFIDQASLADLCEIDGDNQNSNTAISVENTKNRRYKRDKPVKRQSTKPEGLEAFML